MSPFPENLINNLLDSSQADRWRSELVDVFFDADRKRDVIARIRKDATAGGAVGKLGDSEQVEVLRGLIGRLAAQASREAKNFREDEITKPEALLSGAHLEDDIINHYPYPVAKAYRTMIEQEYSAAAAFGCLLDTYEALIHYLGMTVVSAYLRSGSDSDKCSSLLLERLLQGNWSTGVLWSLLRDTVRLAGDCDGNLLFTDLPGYLFKPNGRLTPSGEVLDSFVEVRNSRWGHCGGRADAGYADIFAINRERLDSELARCPWLKRVTLVRPLKVDSEAGCLLRADILMGDRQLRDRPFELDLHRADLAGESGDIREEFSLLLVDEEKRRYLPIFPLSIFQFGIKEKRKTDGIYFLQGTKFTERDETLQLSQAVYVAYESGLDNHKETFGEAGRRLEFHANRLRKSGVVKTENIAATGHDDRVSEPPQDPDFEIPEVRIEQQYHLDLFAGRTQFLAKVRQWITVHPEGGYLLLCGVPGQGKSAIIARLAHEESNQGGGGGVALHMIKSHRTPAQFLPALIRQCARLADCRFGAKAYEGSIDDLRNSLVRACEAVKERTGRCLILIDGLDELEANQSRASGIQSIDFLPRHLPEGVHIILSSRPDLALLESLKNRVGDFDQWTIPSLEPGEMADFLAKRLQPDLLHYTVDWSAVWQRMEGNPLFLGHALKMIATRVEQEHNAGSETLTIDVDSLPTGLSGIFRSIYDELREKAKENRPSNRGLARALVLQLLCAAREPLGFYDLSTLLASSAKPSDYDLPRWSLEECRDLVFEISSYLVDAGQNQFRPWHQGLVDFIREEVGKEGWIQLESGFCDWLSGTGSRQDYALHHCGDHLLSALRRDDLAALLTDQESIRLRFERNCLRELARDLRGLGQDRWDAPFRSLVEVLQDYPDDTWRRRLRAALFDAFGGSDSWPHSLVEAFRNSRHSNSLLFLSDTYDMEGKHAEAVAIFEEVLGYGEGRDLAECVEKYFNQPSTKERDLAGLIACIRMATIYEHLDRCEEGLAAVETLSQIPDVERFEGYYFGWAQYHRGILLLKFLRDGHRAMQIFSAARNAPGVSDDLRDSCLHQMGVIDLFEGRLEEAERKFRDCLECRRDVATDFRRAYEYRRLGEVAALSGKLGKASGLFAEALRISKCAGNRRYVKTTETARRTQLGERAVRDPGWIPEEGERATFSKTIDQNQNEEFLNLLDAGTGAPTGYSMPYREVHERGLWHRTIGVIWLDDVGRIGLQVREEKESAGRFDLAVSGHVTAGESDLEAACREAGEELGIHVDPCDLERAGEAFTWIKEGCPGAPEEFVDAKGVFHYRTGKWNFERMSLFVLRRGTAEGGERKNGMTVEWRDPAEAIEESREHPERYASAFKQVFWGQEWRSVHALGPVEKARNGGGPPKEAALQIKEYLKAAEDNAT